LLQFLQDGLFRPIGAEQPQYADVRVVAATNADLIDEVKNETFRSDLFYRLNVLPVHVPPLRERKADIFGLLKFNLEKYNAKYKRKCTLSREVADMLHAYKWPGNVRELENLVERLVVLAPDNTITIDDLPNYMRTQYEISPWTEEEMQGESLTDILNNIEKNMIVEAYSKYKTTRETDDKLGITQSLLMRRLKKYQISK